MAEDPKRIRATLVDAGWDQTPPPPPPPPPPVPRAGRSGVVMTPVPPPRASVPPPPVVPSVPSAPVSSAPNAPSVISAPPPAEARVEPSRELPAYDIDGPTSEATRVDSHMEARARMMNLLEGPSSSIPAAPERRASAMPPLAEPADAPGFRAALLTRVRFLHGEVPLWSLVTPLVLVAALVGAFAVASVSTALGLAPPAVAVDAAKATLPEPASPAPAVSPLAVNKAEAATTATPSVTPQASAEPASSAALPSLDALPPKMRAAEVLEVAGKLAGRELARARALAAELDRDPTLAQDEKTQAEMRRLLDNPETSRHMLAVIAGIPGPVSADLLYEIWTGTVLRNETTDLARALLLSEDVRPKASPALSVSLDLRQAESCADNAKILPRAIEHGDRRALHLLIKLTRRYGCGANKREDCYPCLRDSDAVDQAVKAVKNRREPKTFGRR